jgi:hypothetical protein
MKIYENNKKQINGNKCMNRNKKTIKLTESDLHKIIKESVNNILTELDWKTYINAARKRKEQANEFRKKYWKGRNSHDNMSDKLESHAQKMFQKQYGKNGSDHNYEGESPSYMGRNTIDMYGDLNFDVKNPIHSKWEDDMPEWDGGAGDKSEVTLRKYRYGNGFPYRDYGKVHDDTFDAYSNWAWTRDVERKDTRRINKDGVHYDPYNSSVGNEISISQDKDYRGRQDAMTNDMLNYYTGKSKYQKGKGWV